MVGSSHQVPRHCAGCRTYRRALRPGREISHSRVTCHTRAYFLARILQFQFHRSLCDIAGTRRVRCTSVQYSATSRPEKSSMRCWRRARARPWQQTLEKLTGTQEMDASAIIDYFAPLMSLSQGAERQVVAAAGNWQGETRMSEEQQQEHAATSAPKGNGGFLGTVERVGNALARPRRAVSSYCYSSSGYCPGCCRMQPSAYIDPRYG